MTENELLEIVENLNRERKVLFKRIGAENNIFNGCVELSSNMCCRLSVVFPQSYPLQLPEIKVIDPEKRFAHMGFDGKLCLIDNSSMLINTTMPEQLLIDCFDKVMEILSVDMKSEDYANEIRREFDSYWLANAKLKLYSALEDDNYGYTEIQMYISRSVRVLATSLQDAKYLACNYLNAVDNDKAFSTKCILIGLREKSKPIALKALYKWSEIRQYIYGNVSGAVKRRFQKFLNLSVCEAVRYIVLSMPGEYGNVFFGFRIHFTNKKKERIKNVTTAKIEQVYIHRIDKSYLLQRSGGETSVSEKQVLLLGCGSVGGYVANNLCQLGIGSLDLLDDDFFSKENIHRHFLGFDALKGKANYKALLLKERLERMYPYVDIDSLDYPDRSVEIFIQKKERFYNYDIIISALGEPTLNLEINRILYEEKIHTPFVCCFNEPYGIGGHAVAVNIDRESCLRCLYTDTISSELVPFRASFVEKNQYFKKNISGCSSAFVPYSCLDSQQTAIMASRLVMDILKGNVCNNQMCYWLGESNELENKGFFLSEFYKLKKKKFTQEINRFEAAKHCPICQNKQG